MSTRLDDVSTEEPRAELAKREPTICAKCRKYQALYTAYATYAPTLHCAGCMRTCERCTC